MKLSTLKQPIPAVVPIETTAGLILFTYNRAVLTPQYIANELGGPIAQKLAEIALDWDVTDDEGVVLRGSDAASWQALFEQIPDEHTSIIYKEVWDDFLGGRLRKDASDAT